jgi:hypothetical protein
MAIGVSIEPAIYTAIYTITDMAPCTPRLLSAATPDGFVAGGAPAIHHRHPLLVDQHLEQPLEHVGRGDPALPMLGEQLAQLQVHPDPPLVVGGDPAVNG